MKSGRENTEETEFFNKLDFIFGQGDFFLHGVVNRQNCRYWENDRAN